ncbi:MAG: type III pantothenate kinase [Clostridia bacterium]
MMQRENGMRKEAVEMLLVFDIGNTEIKMGVFRDDDLVAYWRMITGSRKTSDEYGITMLTMLQQKNITPERY